jgi:hypothetical protein
MNQTNFAALGGKVKKTLIAYEKDVTSPDVKFLSAIAAAGADINYILTGLRAMAVGETHSGYALRPDQAALLDNYEHCSKEDQDCIKRIALTAATAANAANKEISQPETKEKQQNRRQ